MNTEGHDPYIALKSQLAVLDDIIYELQSQEEIRDDIGLLDDLLDIKVLIKRLQGVRKRIAQYCRSIDNHEQG